MTDKTREMNKLPYHIASLFVIHLIMLFTLGCQHLANKNRVSATMHLLKPTEVDHYYLQSLGDFYYLKALHLKEESSSAYIAALKEALFYQPDSLFLRIHLIDAYIDYNMLLKAYREYQSLIPKHANNLELRWRLGQIYEKSGLPRKALHEYRFILSKNQEHPKALPSLTFLSIHLGQFKEAEKLLHRLSLTHWEKSYKVFYILAGLHKSKNQTGKAISFLKKSLKLKPDFYYAVMDLYQLYVQEGKKHLAIKILETYHNNEHTDPFVTITLANHYKKSYGIKKALSLLSGEEYRDWRIVFHLSSLLSEDGQYDKALFNLDRILIDNPASSPQVYILKASLLIETNKKEHALASLKQGLRFFPSDTALHYHAGFLQDQLGYTEEAIHSLQHVLKLDPNHAAALNHLAYLYATQNRKLDSAYKLVTKALSLSPDNSYFMDTAGWILYKKGQPREALKYLKRAFHANMSESLIAEHLAEVYYQLNQIDRSIHLYNKALLLENDEYKRKQILQKIHLLQQTAI